jgi:hypothetical protein
MRFPVVLCKRDTLVVVGRDFFEGIAELDEVAGRLDSNVSADGRAHFHWILDSDGFLYRLRSQGLLPINFLQWLGLWRPRERFMIESAITITVRELISLISGLRDDPPDIPNVTDLARVLAVLPPETVLNREILRDYFGE